MAGLWVRDSAEWSTKTKSGSGGLEWASEGAEAMRRGWGGEGAAGVMEEWLLESVGHCALFPQRSRFHQSKPSRSKSSADDFRVADEGGSTLRMESLSLPTPDMAQNRFSSYFQPHRAHIPSLPSSLGGRRPLTMRIQPSPGSRAGRPRPYRTGRRPRRSRGRAWMAAPAPSPRVGGAGASRRGALRGTGRLRLRRRGG